jgi:hypothetical protein
MIALPRHFDALNLLNYQPIKERNVSPKPIRDILSSTTRLGDPINQGKSRNVMLMPSVLGSVDEIPK